MKAFQVSFLLAGLGSALPSNSRLSTDLTSHVGPVVQARDSMLGCDNADDQAALLAAISSCGDLAVAAEYAAEWDSGDRMKTFFKDDSNETREHVASVFKKVKDLCRSERPETVARCNAPEDHRCAENSVYAQEGDDDLIAVCSKRFFNLDPQPKFCGWRSRGTTIIHEATHLAKVADTNDHAYGYFDITRLNKTLALDNANTYAYFANAVYLGKDECYYL